MLGGAAGTGGTAGWGWSDQMKGAAHSAGTAAVPAPQRIPTVLAQRLVQTGGFAQQAGARQ